jgi:serine/threonine protein kinase
MKIESGSLCNDRYRMVERIGSGGFSVVWKAIDEKAGGMPVAVKIFLPDKGADPSLIHMFEEEYQLTCNLTDNRLVKITDHFLLDESPCLVMPFCPGNSLYYKLQNEERLEEREIAKVIYQIAGALDYLHSQEMPVLHLDIKPENVLIDYSGNYLLSDFGISLKTRSSLMRATNTKGGTFGFSPPEMAETRKLSAKSDIFSLGVMIYELATGDMPWGGMGDNALVINMPKPDLPDEYSPRFQAIMHACMDRYPENRPDALDLEQLARKFLDQSVWGELTPKPSSGLKTIPSRPERRAEAITVVKPVHAQIETVPASASGKTYVYQGAPSTVSSAPLTLFVVLNALFIIATAVIHFLYK